MAHVGDTTPGEREVERSLETMEASMARVSDSALTLAATVLGFSVIFLSGDAAFDHTELLRASWISLGVSIMTAITAKVAAWWESEIDVQWALGVGGPDLRLTWTRRLAILASILSLGIGLAFLLAFGYINVD